MIKPAKNKLWIMPAMVGIILLLSSCKKDKVPVPPTPNISEPTKWEVIPGTYKIYDTLGTYLYDMNISHWGMEMPDGSRRDTFLFENFDGQFSFKNIQSDANIINWPKYYFNIGNHQPLYDSVSDRWQLFGYNAHYSNDSIYMNYQIQNILYYIEDVRPYENRTVRRIGIKQH